VWLVTTAVRSSCDPTTQKYSRNKSSNPWQHVISLIVLMGSLFFFFFFFGCGWGV
jgi:hypothetical protein